MAKAEMTIEDVEARILELFYIVEREGASQIKMLKCSISPTHAFYKISKEVENRALIERRKLHLLLGLLRRIER